jgi:Leucine-rich repeat (LRR) protein
MNNDVDIIYKHINHYHNKMDELISIILNNKDNKILHFCDNNVKIIPGEISCLTNLQELVLNSNKTKIIPGEIKYLTNLKSLYLLFTPLDI